MDFNNYDCIADLYDIYVPATFDIDFFLKETRKTGGEVLELMSGTGRVSIPLLQAGVRLTCVDLSAGLNSILEDKLQNLGLSAQVHRMDVRDLDLKKRFAMVIIPFHSFAHITSFEDQRRVLLRIQEHLLPGGTFICTLGNPSIRRKTVDGQLRLIRKYPMPDTGGKLLLWIKEDFQAQDENVVEAMQFYEKYGPDGLLMEKRLLELHFRISSREEIERLFFETGFEVKAIHGDYEYAPFSPDSPYMIHVLENANYQ